MATLGGRERAQPLVVAQQIGLVGRLAVTTAAPSLVDLIRARWRARSESGEAIVYEGLPGDGWLAYCSTWCHADGISSSTDGEVR
jgi:hypothetical protein